MSNDEGETTLETPGLDKLIKMMAAPAPQTRVGVLGTKASRGDGLNNAEIGAIHEYGEGNNPQRSFLRVPIAEHLQKRLENSGALDKDVLADAVASGTLIPYMKKVAVVAEGIVADAFDTGGFGKWPPSNMNQKTNHQTLVETQQLRNSITSEVKEGHE